MEIVLAIIGGFLVGWMIRGYLLTWALNRLAKEANIDLEKLINDIKAETENVKVQTQKLKEKTEQDDVVHVKLEEHHGHFYMFREDNDQFLAQGSTFDEIKNLIKAKHPNIIVAAAPGTDPDLIARFKATKA